MARGYLKWCEPGGSVGKVIESQQKQLPELSFVATKKYQDVLVLMMELKLKEWLLLKEYQGW